MQGINVEERRVSQPAPPQIGSNLRDGMQTQTLSGLGIAACAVMKGPGQAVAGFSIEPSPL